MCKNIIHKKNINELMLLIYLFRLVFNEVEIELLRNYNLVAI